MKCFLLLALAAAAQAQNEPVFRSEVALVRIDAEAVDASGRLVPGLTKDDFRVLDNGATQPLLNFSFAEEPLDLILLFDTGGGMHGKLTSMVRATELGFHELHRGDRVSVRAFSASGMEVLPFSDNLQTVNEAILIRVLGLKFGGASRLAEAADEAAVRFAREEKTRRKRAVLVVTDKAPVREPNEASAVRDLWKADAVLSELILDRATLSATQTASGIVDKTGGIVIASGNPALHPGEAFRDSVHYLRSGYTMYYRLPESGAGLERAVRVELTEDASKRLPGVRVRARSGYIAP